MMTLGLDLSLTSTGAVVMDSDQKPIAAWVVIKSSGKKGDGPETFLDRINKIATEFDDWLFGVRSFRGTPSLSVIEAPSHGSSFGNPHERAGLWWEIFRRVHESHGIPTATVAPATRAKYIAGHGRASKPEVLVAARRMYGEEIPNDDVADAAGLAAMGMRFLGHPVEKEISTKQLEAFKGVKGWPPMPDR